MGWRTWMGRLRLPAPASVLRWLSCALAATIVAMPLSLVHAIETAQFTDELGTFPVSVTLSHNGYSTLDTGLLGKVYLSRTGPLGFGITATATGPPEAGGTLASYVDPQFIKANVALIDDPDRVASAYGNQAGKHLRATVLRDEFLAAVLGGTALFLIIPRRRLAGLSRLRVGLASAGVVVVSTGLSGVFAWQLFNAWPGSAVPTETYPLANDATISFDNPQMLEVADQIEPFIKKNTTRLEARAARYEQSAAASFKTALAPVAGDLAPRSGETIVIAEADPQGSFVGVHVRKAMYRDLRSALGSNAISLRTIAGDITSNGTVAESKYVDDEAAVSGSIPTVAVAGDHDSTRTWKQIHGAGITNPDFTTKTTEGIRVAGANDREHKTLFGGAVTDPSGITEPQLGERLRKSVEKDHPEDARITLLHQAYAVAGYLGVPDIDQIGALSMKGDKRTMPYDDGIADQPPGIVDYGHWHVAAGPWVIWNTDGNEVTWTVVDQLGTAGGVENQPTLSRFSTPISAPLKPIMVRLQYLNKQSGLQTGYVTIQCGTDGLCSISPRVDVGLPGGRPVSAKSLGF